VPFQLWQVGYSTARPRPQQLQTEKILLQPRLIPLECCLVYPLYTIFFPEPFVVNEPIYSLLAQALAQLPFNHSGSSGSCLVGPHDGNPVGVLVPGFDEAGPDVPRQAPMAVAHGLAPALLGPMRVAQEDFWYLNRVKLALMSPLQAPMAMAQGLVPALLGPMRVAQEEFLYLDLMKLALVSPLQAPMAVAQGLVPALLGPMRVAQEEFWYLDMVKLALMSPQQAPMAVA